MTLLQSQNHIVAWMNGESLASRSCMNMKPTVTEFFENRTRQTVADEFILQDFIFRDTLSLWEYVVMPYPCAAGHSRQCRAWACQCAVYVSVVLFEKIIITVVVLFDFWREVSWAIVLYIWQHCHVILLWNADDNDFQMRWWLVVEYMHRIYNM